MTGRIDWPGVIEQAASIVDSYSTGVTLRRYGAAGRLTLYRVGVKLLQVDLDELDRIIRPVPTSGHGG